MKKKLIRNSLTNKDKDRSHPNFIKKEVSIYLSQTFLFFWFAFLFSECLTNEEKLLKYIDGVISNDLVITILYTIIASIITLGSIEFIVKGLSDASFLKLVSDDVALSIGRAMYTLGSSITGACIAICFFSLIHYTIELAVRYLWLSIMISFVMFLYGFFISFWCNRGLKIGAAKTS